MGSRQAADHRGGDRPAQGLLLSGAPPRQDVGRAAGTPGGQGRGLHLWTANQRLPRPPAATFGGSARLTNCTSVVLACLLTVGVSRRALCPSRNSSSRLLGRIKCPS